MQQYSPFSLGATLYMPATRDDILSVAVGNKIANLKSMVICLEDAVAQNDVLQALANLKQITLALASRKRTRNTPIIFVRPRDIAMAEHLIAHYDLRGIDGFVFPKFTLETLNDWHEVTQNTDLIWMPTLETKEIFNVIEMQKLATVLAAHSAREKIIALRIGGNDLMNVLGIRRSRSSSIYEGPLGYVIKMLSCTFGAMDFALTSPVFELLENPVLLAKELQQDLVHGLVGKTAIHPSQIEQIQNAWMVEHAEYEDAIRILNSTKAVYQHAGAMCEPATHRQWAKNTLERSRLFGIIYPEKEVLGI